MCQKAVLADTVMCGLQTLTPQECRVEDNDFGKRDRINLEQRHCMGHCLSLRKRVDLDVQRTNQLGGTRCRGQHGTYGKPARDLARVDGFVAYGIDSCTQLGGDRNQEPISWLPLVYGHRSNRSFFFWTRNAGPRTGSRQRQHSTAVKITVMICTIMATGRGTTCNLLFSNRLHQKYNKIPFKTLKRRYKQLANQSAKYTAHCPKSRSRNKDKKHWCSANCSDEKQSYNCACHHHCWASEGLPRQCTPCALQTIDAIVATHAIVTTIAQI